MQVDQINLSGIVERYIVFKTSGSIKERTQTSIEMGAGCQRNGLEMGVDRGEDVCWKGCPYFRQLANSTDRIFMTILPQIYLWTRKNRLHFGSYPVLNCEDPESEKFRIVAIK